MSFPVDGEVLVVMANPTVKLPAPINVAASKMKSQY
jgi:hypothetical protein